MCGFLVYIRTTPAKDGLTEAAANERGVARTFELTLVTGIPSPLVCVVLAVLQHRVCVSLVDGMKGTKNSLGKIAVHAVLHSLAIDNSCSARARGVCLRYFVMLEPPSRRKPWCTVVTSMKGCICTTGRLRHMWIFHRSSVGASTAVGFPDSLLGLLRCLDPSLDTSLKGNGNAQQGSGAVKAGTPSRRDKIFPKSLRSFCWSVPCAVEATPAPERFVRTGHVHLSSSRPGQVDDHKPSIRPQDRS